MRMIAFEVGRSKFDKVATLGVEHIGKILGRSRKAPVGGSSLHPLMGISSRSPNTALYQIQHSASGILCMNWCTQAKYNIVAESREWLSLDLVPDMSVWLVCHWLHVCFSYRNTRE